MIYVLNIVLTILTFVGYVLPFLAPKLFPFLSILTLALPILLILNFLFLFYWLLQIKKQVFLSSIILIIGISFISKLYKFPQEQIPVAPEDFTVMSFNVHYFNLYKWLDKDVHTNISQFIKKEAPDVICIQEFHSKNNIDFSAYSYQYVYIKNYFAGHAILSKYPIINKGDIAFEDSNNNLLFADIIKNKDTIRVYSMHLESLKISDDIEKKIDQKKSEVLLKRIGTAFKRQQLQSDLIKEHKKQCNYPIIICGDMNNSAFSFVYRNIKGDLLDCFEERGSGFGRTYHFKYFPARIDYIFADKRFKIKDFITFSDFINSDHFPIMTRLSIKDKK